MRAMASSAASFPSCASGCLTVVSGGETSAETKMSSKPTTERSRGTSSASSRAASTAPSAMRSLAQKSPVTSGSRARRSAAAARPAAREERESLVEGDDRRAGLGEGAQGAVGAVGAPQVEEAVDALVVQRLDVARLERGIQLRGADDDRVAAPGRGDFGGVHETAEE